MRNPERETPGEMSFLRDDDPDLVYASDVQVMAEAGGVQLTFVRSRPAGETLVDYRPIEMRAPK